LAWIPSERHEERGAWGRVPSAAFPLQGHLE